VNHLSTHHDPSYDEFDDDQHDGDFNQRETRAKSLIERWFKRGVTHLGQS
jgi:hypothetical protein